MCCLHHEGLGHRVKIGCCNLNIGCRTLKNVHLFVLGGVRGLVVSCGIHRNFMKHVDETEKPFLDMENKVLINWLCVS